MFNTIKLLCLFYLLSSFCFQRSIQQYSITLSKSYWQVTNSNKTIRIPATVPGGIYSDLKRAGVLKQDILFYKNDVAYRWVGLENWTYQTTFIIDQAIARSDSVSLVLYGVDTIAVVYLNDRILGTMSNMFVRYKFDIKSHLKLSGVPNVLVIQLESPIKESRRKSQQSIRQNHGKIIPPYCPPPSQHGECHINFLRKMQASFGWDWGPAFPSVGIFKDVAIEYGNFGILRDVLVETKRICDWDTPKEQPSKIVISSNIRDIVRDQANNNRTNAYDLHQSKFQNEKHHFDPNSSQVFLLNKSQCANILADSPQNAWLLKITLVLEMASPNVSYDLRVDFNIDDELHYESEHTAVLSNNQGIIRLGFNLKIDSQMTIHPWWPNNAGQQNLYKMKVRVRPLLIPSEHIHLNLDSDYDSDPKLDFRDARHQLKIVPSHVSEKQIKFGFRTVELIQEPIAGNGSTFMLRINGIDMFAMGSNWIPAHILPELSSDMESIRYLLKSVKDANMNMLRVWGGGLYESDKFYELADSMGIMIWQDFMFACALYPTDDEYITSVKTEIEQQVQRLQHHPSVVIWAGNNENELAISGFWWPETIIWHKKLKEMYFKLYVETIKPIVEVLDSTRPFVESSPSNGLLTSSQAYHISRFPNNNKFGDVHHYDYISDSFDWTKYPSNRFASEYGFQSYPSFDAISSASLPPDWKYPLNQNIIHRQHRMTGEVEIKHQIKLHFKEPLPGGIDKLKQFIYLSQLSQAIAVKTETEYYRRNRFVDENGSGKTMGALYWQLNDVWAAPSWSSIEIDGRWKILHYFARRFFSPIQVVPYINHLVLSSPPPNQDYSSIGTLTSNFAGQTTTNTSPYIVIDLLRDDLMYRLTSFNVTIKLYRWTSWEPIWEKTIYILNTSPNKVYPKIFEYDLNKLMRQVSNGVSLSKCVFSVAIEEQPRYGFKQINNYLMPVYPNKITAMRIATITVEKIQGPFQAYDLNPDGLDDPSWACAYRMTIFSDSIAMFVWIDLNLSNLMLGDVVSKNTTSFADVEPVSLVHPPDKIKISSREQRSIDYSVTSPSLTQGFQLPNTRNKAKMFESGANNSNSNLRFQLSDNAFNMFEPTKTVDLFLSACVDKSRLQSSLEIQSLVDTL